MAPLITVKPISKKAKNRFANLLKRCEHCTILQHNGDRMLLAPALAPEEIFWVNVSHDQDWLLEM